MSLPAGWARTDAAGLGPFVTRERFQGPDGTVVEWNSRDHRKRAGRLDAGRGSTWWAPTAVGWWIGVLFAIGSVCFAVGAAPGYVDWVGTDADAITFFVGSIFFTSAAYLQFVQTVNAPHALTSGSQRPLPLLDVGTGTHRLVRERRAARRHGLLQRDDARGDRHQPRRDPGPSARVGARHGRLDLLPRRQRARVVRGEPRLVVVEPAQPRLADRRAQPARFDRVRRVGRRVEDRDHDRRTPQHHARESRDRGRRRLLPRRRAVPAPRTHPGSLRPHCTEPGRFAMALHRKITDENPIDAQPALLAKRAEEGHAPRHTLPDGRARPRRRVPARARRAHARRQRAAQPRDVRDHVDGAAGAAAHVGDVRQEHDRQGRVPAHGRDRDALRQHVEPAVELARQRGGDRHVDHRVERGRDARRAWR